METIKTTKDGRALEFENGKFYLAGEYMDHGVWILPASTLAQLNKKGITGQTHYIGKVMLTAAEAEVAKGLVAEYRKMKDAEEESTRRATVSFWVLGWESHFVSVDTRKNLDEQFAAIAAHYPHDCTVDSVRKAYEEHTSDAAQTEMAAKVEAAAANNKRLAAFARAKDTGERQMLRQLAEDCDDPREECSLDICTEWALPDGSTEITRQHTW